MLDQTVLTTAWACDAVAIYQCKAIFAVLAPSIGADGVLAVLWTGQLATSIDQVEPLVAVRARAIDAGGVLAVLWTGQLTFSID